MIDYALPIWHNDKGKITLIEWEGPPLALFNRWFLDSDVDLSMLWIGDKFRYGDIPLKILDFDVVTRNFTVARLDVGIIGKIQVITYWFICWFELVNYRILKTFEIWNLLEGKQGEKLSWDCLRIFRSK